MEYSTEILHSSCFPLVSQLASCTNCIMVRTSCLLCKKLRGRSEIYFTFVPNQKRCTIWRFNITHTHTLVSASRWCSDRKSVSCCLSDIDWRVCLWQLRGLVFWVFFFFVPVTSCFSTLRPISVFCARLTSLSTRPDISRAAQQVCTANICTCINKEQQRLETREEIKAW